MSTIEKKNITSTDVSAMSLGLILALFSISQKFIPLCIGIWILLSVYDAIKSKNRPSISWQKVLLPLLFILFVIGLGWSENQDMAWFDLEVKMSLFIVPIMFLFLNYSLKQWRLIIKSFLFGTIVGVIYLLIAAAIQFEISHEFKSMLYFHLSGTVHPAYLSYYLNIAITILLLDYTFGRLSLFKDRKLYLIFMAIFSLFSLLLLSKNGILTTIGLDLAALVVLWRRGFWKYVLMAVLGVVISSVVVYKKSAYVQDRLGDLVFGVQEGATDKWLASTSMRIVIWKAGMKVLSESPVYGHGTGDVKDVLYAQYVSDDDERLVQLKLNAHNQFIQTGIAVGIGGSAILLIVLILPMLRPKKNFGYAAIFAGMTFIFFLTESVLETQAGVVGFAFFLVIFSSFDRKLLGDKA